MGDIIELDMAFKQDTLNSFELISVNGDDTAADITDLCRRGLTPVGNVAAICVAAKFSGMARRTLDQFNARDVKVIAAISSSGNRLCADFIETQAYRALLAGADEIELVYPVHAFLSGNRKLGAELVSACRGVCGRRKELTVTLETGLLRDPQIIREVCRESILAGATFLKTSTGKAIVNATPQASRIMIEAIAETAGQVGLKVVGGFRSLSEAKVYLEMAMSRFGPRWLESGRFRLGAANVMDELLDSSYE